MPAGFNGAASRSLRSWATSPRASTGSLRFNGGRKPEPAELRPRCCCTRSLVRLQWGRKPEPAEFSTCSPVSGAHQGFNGAASRSLRSWDEDPITGAFFQRCFNGAASRSLRSSAGLVRRDGLEPASMGPQAGACGVYWLRRKTRLITSRFNGAASRSLRKLIGRQIGTYLATALQWGRKPEPAELRKAQTQAVCLATLQWGRKPEPAELFLSCPTGPFRTGFNGAASRSLRSCHRRPASRRRLRASMGPQAGACGVSCLPNYSIVKHLRAGLRAAP